MSPDPPSPIFREKHLASDTPVDIFAIHTGHRGLELYSSQFKANVINLMQSLPVCIQVFHIGLEFYSSQVESPCYCY